ncbi:MAG: GIY-YIG nuclease family protein [Rhizomicrobium sp.]
MVSRDQFKILIAAYRMASRRHGTIYIGVTSELRNRVYQHREGLTPGFTKTYGVHRLVWFERHDEMTAAIRRESLLKKYKREWKINLIEKTNPYWIDLFPSLVGKIPDRGSSLSVNTAGMGGRDEPGHDEI